MIDPGIKNRRLTSDVSEIKDHRKSGRRLRKRLILMAILISVGSLPALAACSGALAPPADLVGTWEAASDFEYTLKLNDDCSYQITYSKYQDPYEGEWSYSVFGDLPYITLEMGSVFHDIVPISATTDEGPKRSLCLMLAYELDWEGGFEWLHCGMIFIEKTE